MLDRLRRAWAAFKDNDAEWRQGVDEKLNTLLFDVSAIRAEFTSFSRDELNPTRKAASNALGRRVMDRLIAEDKARRHTTGDL